MAASSQTLAKKGNVAQGQPRRCLLLIILTAGNSSSCLLTIDPAVNAFNSLEYWSHSCAYTAGQGCSTAVSLLNITSLLLSFKNNKA